MPNIAKIDHPFQTFRVGHTQTVAYHVSDCIGCTAAVLTLQNVQGVLVRGGCYGGLVVFMGFSGRAGEHGKRDTVRWSRRTINEELGVLKRDTL
jgi:hypothetical protein